MRESTTSTLLCSSLTYLMIVELELWIELNLFTKLTNINKNFPSQASVTYKQLDSFIAL